MPTPEKEAVYIEVPQDLALSLQDVDVSCSGTSGVVEPLFGQGVSSGSVGTSGTAILQAANRKRRLDTAVTTAFTTPVMSMDMHLVPIRTTSAPVTTSAIARVPAAATGRAFPPPSSTVVSPPSSEPE